MKKKIYLAICLFTLTCFSISAQKQDPVIDQDNSTKDQIILDDLIVDGSTCVGFDCVNGESFGFDTHRLKENNVRIHFNDTSNSSSFPNNDWRIVINDSNNGGANYFAIEDASAGRQVFRVEAAAPANSLYVDDGGRIGFGTSTPVVDLHVVGGDSPTMRLEQDGSSGFTPQTWDVAGNEANFFIRDVTNGSTLPFRIQPGAPSNSIYVAAGGDIGLGTASPLAKLHIENGDNDFVVTEDGKVGIGIDSPVNKLQIVETGTNNNFISFEAPNGAVQLSLQTDSANRRIIARAANGAPESQITLQNGGIFTFSESTGNVFSRITAGSTTLTASSSRYLKTNITNLEVPNILKRISSVPVTKYNWRSDLVNKELANRQVVGLIAQDFYTVLNTGKDTEINGQDVQMALWMGVQALHKENTEIKVELEENKSELEELNNKVGVLTNQLNEIKELLGGNNSVDATVISKGLLKQNYPNPHNGETVIEYTVPNLQANSLLQIFDAAGKLIKTISLNNGFGKINLTSNDLPSGNYNYSLLVDGNIVDTKKMTVAK